MGGMVSWPSRFNLGVEAEGAAGVQEAVVAEEADQTAAAVDKIQRHARRRGTDAQANRRSAERPDVLIEGVY